MKSLVFDVGGRPVANDDFTTLQTEFTDALVAPYAGRGGFIVSGCQVSGSAGAYTISPGIVCLDGEFCRFYGQSNVDFLVPQQLQRAALTVIQTRQYETGGTKTCIAERVAILADRPLNITPTYDFVIFTAAGGRRWEHMLKNAVHSIGQLQALAPEDYVPAHYNAVTGKGLAGTPAWGWQLCNGYGGILDAREKFLVGASSTAAYVPGATGGEENVTLTEAQIPPLTLRLFGSDDSAGDGGFPDLGDDTNQATAVSAGRKSDTAVKSINTLGQAHNNLPPYVAVPMRKWIGI